MAIQGRPGINPTEPQTIDLLSFRLGNLVFAIHLAPILQLIEMVTVIPLPKATDLVEGMINVHGSMVPLIDLRRYLNIYRPYLELHTPIILVSVNQRTMGLIVDEVLGVINFSAEQLSQADNFLPPALQPEPVFGGIIKANGSVSLLLNLDRLFSSDHSDALAQLDEALLSMNNAAKTELATGLPQ